MPFQSNLQLESTGEPQYQPCEYVLLRQPLVYLFSGSDVKRDAEGRGTLIISNQRVLFLSDEDSTKNMSFDARDFSMHGLSLNRFEWPHHYLLAKIEEDCRQWKRRVLRSNSESDEESDEEIDSSEQKSNIDAVASSKRPQQEEYVEIVVEELRWVAPKGDDSILRKMYDAWNKMDDLNEDLEDEDGDEYEDAENEDDANGAYDDVDDGAVVVPASSSRAQPSARKAMLDRLDRMLIVPPVVSAANQLQVSNTSSSVPIATTSESSSAAFSSLPPTVAAESCPSCAILRTCSSCVIDRSECSYSGAQLKRKGKRVCKICVAKKEGTALPMLHNPSAASQVNHAEASSSDDADAAVQSIHQLSLQPAATDADLAIFPPPANLFETSLSDVTAAAASAAGTSSRAAKFAAILAGVQANLDQLK